MASVERDPEGQGPKRPTVGTPPRRPNSVRRTSTIEGFYPQGPSGPAHLALHGRDLYTGPDGGAAILAEAEVRLELEGPSVVKVEARPAEARLACLVGAQPSRGWRAAVEELVPDHSDERSLLHLLLDALPGWMMLSSFGLTHAPYAWDRPAGAPNGGPLDLSLRADLCAGWQTGGALLQLVSEGRSGADFFRPAAPTLESVDDPLAWHRVEPLPPYGSRRRRRVDVIAGTPILIDGMFRDTSADGNGAEGVIHEYTVTAAVDRGTWRVVESAAVPRSLPYPECPQAAGSAGQLVDRDVRDLRRVVGREMRGPTTCTHLNELYRTFADVASLAAHLPGNPTEI